MAANKFLGHYKLESSDNLEEFMKTLGVNIVLRKIGMSSYPDLTMEHIEGDHYKINEWTMIKSHIWDFTLGQEFKDKTVDGRNVLSTIRIEGDKLVQIEKPASGKGKIPSYTWELKDNNDLHITYELEGVVCNREYKRLK
ncbi:cellular retinoic acid-binding protein 2-like [Amphiura filiformis]|uniref:cellular retinoic acid-binding protein 2-like n=1 Tax=Amphiura filiformis TaxID=82378 RepID=UPI003B21F6D9